ncbi:LysM domain-containing protein [Alteromonas sp. 1_MG-2023]|uniref:LysM peptidoglycan-binding domain-containing protein n=1 Tax=Alteromonas sp. 1_MG-2023 TaxID=3062669 RepID=UPI0026E1DD83|nr:LysM domain-containing protein [Alteromonas sp. 1_MG-2023]MDO6566729.1 LysM domain-containing protein [Alteromonas sp. 1_MG-2023]
MKNRLKNAARTIVVVVACFAAFSTMAKQLKETAPQTYTVKKGDTLWGIANLFLNQPWLWPELWRHNTQINNPHLIYPGDVISVSYINGEPVFTINRDKPKLVLSPGSNRRVKGAPIETLAWSVLAPFIKQHTLVSEEDYSFLPHLLGNHGGNVSFVSDDLVVSQQENRSEDQYQVVRKHSIIRNMYGEVLGVQLTHVANATLEGDVSLPNSRLVKLSDSNQEARRGDKLLTGDFTLDDDLVLQEATSQRGFVVGDLHDHDLLGRYDVVVVDLGENDVAPGTVMGLYSGGPDIIDGDEPEYADNSNVIESNALFSTTVQQPALKVGEIIVFKTFESASYGIITRAKEGVKRGFIVAKP